MQRSNPGAPGMTDTVNNNDSGNLQSILIALFLNLIAPWAAWIPVVPEWLVRNVGLILTALLIFVFQKALGKWIDRRWPERKRKPGDSQG